MSSDFYVDTAVAAMRRARHCYWCHAAMPIGGSAIKVAVKYDGVFSTIYVHHDCKDAWLRDPCNEEEDGCLSRHLRGCTCNETIDAEEAALHVTEATS